jgi:glycosyltransferase involved in cell wall biosynthesis
VKVTVVIPVLYEEPLLETALRDLAALRDRVDLEILVVVDVPDPAREADSRRVVEPAAERAGARAIFRVGTRGFGSALRAAFAEASGDAVLPFMADGSDRASDIPSMVKALEGGDDVVSGSRYMKGGGTVGMTTKQRMSHAYSALMRLAGGPPIHDVSNAFKAYRRDVVESIATEADSFDLSVELTVKASGAGFRVGEVPTVWTNREVGRSNFHVGRETMHYGRWLAYAVRSRFRRPAPSSPTGRAPA